jgi:ubiquinone/menaquinone biosynthesis C-methylase UbiE
LKKDTEFKRTQRSFYDVRYAMLSRAVNKLSNIPMLFYDKRLMKLALETAGKNEPVAVLDVGAGQGTDAILLSDKCKSVVAIDISKNALSTAKTLSKLDDAHDHISFVQADAEHLPFKEDAFDCVYCKDVLHHVSDSLSAVLEMKRVAQETTSLIAIEANGCNPQMVAIGLLYHSVDSGVFKNTRSRISNIFLEAGLHSVKVTETEFLPRHTLFEYRSPLRRFFGSNSFLFRVLQKLESDWQKHESLHVFSNYLIVSGLKKSNGVGLPNK